MEESWLSKIRRWKNHPDQFKSQWYWELQKLFKNHGRFLYAVGLVIAGAIILKCTG